MPRKKLGNETTAMRRTKKEEESYTVWKKKMHNGHINKGEEIEQLISVI